MEFVPKRPELCEAISNKQVITFEYHGKQRKGNPQCYGINTNSKEALRVHLVQGGTRDEQLFLCDEMSSFKITKERFSKPGPNYQKNDKAMIHIFQQLDSE